MRLSINEYKERISSYITKANQEGWVNDEESHSLIDQINKDDLTIGVVGQMNVGKSSLINSLIFGKETLPTSEVPMTAALTYISYGDAPSANVEMLSLSDYEEIKEKSVLEVTEENKAEVESARKIIKGIELIPSYAEALGTTINIPLSQFDEYVGVGGTYTPMVKFLRLTLNNPELQGICIVDTPGYNDPVSSRDMTTKKFLSKANVIIMVQDIQSHFSRPDMDLIRDQIPNSGIGKLVIVLNKKDSINSNDIERVLENANEHKKAIISKDQELAPLLESCEIIPVSSMMSLLGQMSDADIAADEALSFWYSQIEYDFPDLKKSDYVAYSSLPMLQQKISDIVLRQKKDILLKAPCEKLLSLLKVYKNKCSVEKDSLKETNDYLSDQQLDIDSVLSDLQTFTESVTGFMSDMLKDSESFSKKKIEETRYTLRDFRDREINGINFIEKKDKKYLRRCFELTEELYYRLNTRFGDALRSMGNDISDFVHDELATLEKKMNMIVLKNSQLIHTSVIRRIGKTVDCTIPRTLSDDQTMKATFPDFWDRQDIYQEGIKSYFRKMVRESFSNSHINKITDRYESALTAMTDTIENEIGAILEDTKSQYSANDRVEIENKIRENNERIQGIEKILPDVDSLIGDVMQLLKD